MSLSSSCCCTPAPNYTTDQSALLAFKSHITYDPSNILASNWSTNTSICNWIGISCRSRGGQHRVTSLDLSNMGLRGTIPPQIGNLSFLAYFNISKNEFNGHLPAGSNAPLKGFPSRNDASFHVHFFFLVLLKFLLLDFNKWKGGRLVCQWLQRRDSVSHFQCLSSIQQINFGNNSFSGCLPDNLCHRLPKLTLFSVSSNEFFGEIPSKLGECRQLQDLSSSSNVIKNW